MKNRLSLFTIFMLLTSLITAQVNYQNQEHDNTSYDTTYESLIKKLFARKNTLQDTVEYWKIGGNGNVNFSQVHFSDNWNKGGISSLSLLTDLGIFANYTIGKSSWENNLDYNYGIIKSGEQNLRKNEDKIEMNSKFGQKAFSNFFYSFLVNLQTQLFDGYDYIESDGLDSSVLASGIFSPAYLIISIGMDYRPTDNFTILLSPLTSKTTFVLRDNVPVQKYGIKPGENNRKEIGAFMKAMHLWEITEDVSWENKLDLFTNYLDQPEKIDVNWESKLFLKVNEFLATTISANLIYDYDQDDEIQFKEALAVGFSYKF